MISSVNSRERLLILACSATKKPDPGRIPALKRYDGPLWRTLRATDPNGVMSKVGSRQSGAAIVMTESQVTGIVPPAVAETDHDRNLE